MLSCVVFFSECFYSDNSYLDGNGNDLVTIETATTGQCIDRCVQVQNKTGFRPYLKLYHPPASAASREVANLIERKNTHTLVYGVKEFVCLSVCLSVTNFDPNYLRTG